MCKYMYIEAFSHSRPYLISSHLTRNHMHCAHTHPPTGWWMGQVSGKVGWVPPSYLKKVDKGDSTEGESDSDDEYLGLPGCECTVYMYVIIPTTLTVMASQVSLKHHIFI